MFRNGLFVSALVATTVLLAACSGFDVPDVVEEPSSVQEAVETDASQAADPSEAAVSNDYSYPIVDTNQAACYDNSDLIDCPAEGDAFYGQDAQYTGTTPSYTDNGDGTVTDNLTGLVWEQTPDAGNYSWDEARAYCESLSLGDSDTWRMPSLKELFSISDFSAGWPYLDQTYFDLTTTDSISKDEQYWSSNYYAGHTAEGQYDAAFGVNHATGHIKAYPALVTGPMGKHVRCVSGDEYGINEFVENGDGTVTDDATGLMWMQADSGEGMDWESALAYAQEMNEASYLGYSDWRLPDVKELQSIVDYDYAPDAQDPAYAGPAINPMFSVSEVTSEAGDLDYPYFWTSTSARFQAGGDYYYAWYVAAGRAVNNEGVDYHGAGAVRFDVKVEGGPAGEGDERVYNYVRLVRGGDVSETPEGDPNASDAGPELEFTDSGTGSPDGVVSGGPGGQPGGKPDFAAAAEALGVSEEALIAALGDLSQGPPDVAAAAAALGVSEEDLMEVLGGPQGGALPQG
jgi:hypothetical protein